MTFGRLLLRNLLFHWRGNLAIFLGVVVGSAVLTGALLVGDSLRGSLRNLALQRLGWVDQALVAGRFFREELADQNKLDVTGVAPAILLQGSASSKLKPRIGRVTILGVTDRFWLAGQAPEAYDFNKSTRQHPFPLTPSMDPRPGGSDFWGSKRDEVVLSKVLADELRVKPGDRVTLFLQKVSGVPRETLLGRRDSNDVVDEWEVTVRAVPEDAEYASFANRFSLSPNPTAPRNAFVPLSALQAKLGQPGRINAILVSGGTEALQENLGSQLTLDDWGLLLYDPQARFRRLDRNGDGKLIRKEWSGRVPRELANTADNDGILSREAVIAYYSRRGYVSLESRTMLLEPAVAAAALEAANAAKVTAAPTLVYLANSISDGKNAIPYSVVAALDPTLPAPLGPFLPPDAKMLLDDEIVLADWKDSPLQAKLGDPITLAYFEPQEQGKLVERTATFRLKGLVPLEPPANDPDLTPEFPGITDQLTLAKWNPPFPYDNKRVKPRDDRYWEQYRATPKAYVTLAAGQKLWGSRFGDLTSVRVASHEPADLSAVAGRYEKKLLKQLKPNQGGFVFDPVRADRLQASAGSMDFGWLFLGFSFFLIAAALLLIGLLFRLNLDRRASEIGLLLAIGYRLGTVRWLLIAEGSLLAVLGGLVGLAGAVIFSGQMLRYLATSWPREPGQTTGLTFLQLHMTGTSFAIGYILSLVVSVLTIAWAVWALGRIPPRALLAGQTTAEAEAGGERRPARWSRWVAGISAVGALILLACGNFVPNHEMQAMTFFSSGALLLTASLAAAWAWMRRTTHHSPLTTHHLTVSRLGTRNAARHAVRSLLTAGLLASATFVVVAVESFHRTPGKDFLKPQSGSGGYVLLGESDLPIYQDLNTEKGRDELNFSPKATEELKGVTIAAFRLRAGDDASCLNLYQPRRPRILGMSKEMIETGGFRFASSEAQTAAERDNPWLLLEKPLPDGVVPVVADANTVAYRFGSSLGGTLEVQNERGDTVKLRFVGLLAESVFQSEVLMSESSFLRLYPHHEGYNFFLIAAPPDRARAVQELLEKALARRGFETQYTVERLQAYLDVENTYLSTFQALGGLGLLLGALGLAVVLLRTIWERRGELALLQALGFRRGVLSWLMLAENGFLLVLGLSIGTGAALLAVAPHLADGGAVPWTRLLGLLGLVLSVGLAAGAGALATTLRAPLVPALRRE